MIKFLLKKSPAIVQVNNNLKGWFQEHQAHSSLQNYQQVACRQGIVVPDVDSIAELLRRRIAVRRANKLPSIKGQLNIFLTCTVTNWERILPESLAPFGQVHFYDWREHGFDDRSSDWLARRDAMNQDMLSAFQQAGHHRPVDVVVGYLSGNNTHPQVLEQMAGAGAVIFNFCWDDKVYFPGHLRGGRYHSPAAIAHAVDLNLTNAPDSVVKYAVHDGLALFWPEAAHPDHHRPVPGLFQYDVSFIGSRYGWRAELIEKIAASGISVTCFGRGWPNGSVSDQQMIDIYSRSRINLGFSAVAHTRKICCLKARDFEIPMSGGLYLTQYHSDLDHVYRVGEEILAWRTADECIAMIRMMLDNPQQADAIRQAGRRRALEDHTYEKRWSQIFQLAGLIE